MILYEKHHSSLVGYLYRQFDTDLNFKTHFHHSFEFVYVFDGEIFITVDDKEIILKKGEGVLILPNQIHSYRTENYSKTFIFIFANSFIAKFYNYSLNLCSSDPIIDLIDNNQIIETLQHSNDVYLLKSALYYLAHCYCKKPLIERKGIYNSLIGLILKTLENNYTSISLKTLAKQLGYDYHYLSNYINEKFGTNFCGLLNEFRINKFCELIEETDANTPIKELAHKCGYTSLRTFNRNFIKLKGITPNEYKSNLK